MVIIHGKGNMVSNDFLIDTLYDLIIRYHIQTNPLNKINRENILLVNKIKITHIKILETHVEEFVPKIYVIIVFNY